jgi:hypothetical protein
MKRNRFFLFALTFVMLSSFFVGQAAAAPYGYLGNGKFSTKNLRWRFAGPTADAKGSYVQPALNAAYGWDYYTNLSLTRVYDNTYHALVYVGFWGNTGWNGYAYICNTGNVCNNQAAWDGWFKYCWAEINTGSSWIVNGSQTHRQQTMAHELGHCWSLAHRNESNAVMYTYGPTNYPWPNANDVWYVNNRYY